MPHDMPMLSLGRGWMLTGMAQLFPIASFTMPSADDSPLDRSGLYVTQPAIMLNVESDRSRVVLRTTLNFEGMTQPWGELTFGGWGEEFIDKRHPHTLLHEAMLSLNLYSGADRGASLSAGKGFAPYGTDDPMSRPVVKYPTNHHLSQILERWTLNGVIASRSWSLEAGLFGGAEPTGPYDFSNIESFGDSWSARVTRRVGPSVMATSPWEISASYGRVAETHDGQTSITTLFNGAVRHELDYAPGRVYALLEASRSNTEHDGSLYSVNVEASLTRGAHKPYARVEMASRPEFAREGPPDTGDFFRYDHDQEPIGTSEWLIATAGYGLQTTKLPYSIRPFVETSFHRVRQGRGDIDPANLFGRSSFWTVSAGFRVFLGADGMRMGMYGVLDPMTSMHRMAMGQTSHGSPTTAPR